MGAYSFCIFFLVTLLLLLGCELVVAQVTVQNPLIWQTLVSPYSNNNFDYVSDATSKYYSQDFQTVIAYNDIYVHNERLLINAGDGCQNLAFNTNGLSAFIKRQPVMGLVARGGGCNWSTKINTMKTLVLENSNLDMTGVLLYDNMTYSSDQSMVHLLPSQQLKSTYWNSTTLQPAQRNISNMLDNDISNTNNGSPNVMAIYFVPQGFAEEMLGKMNNTNSHYVMLAAYFTDSVMKDNPSNTGDGSISPTTTSSSSDNNSGADNMFGAGNRGYIAYLVAAGAAIVMAIILFRWCRNPRFGLARYRRHDNLQMTTNGTAMEVGMEPLNTFPHDQHHHHHDPSPPCIPIEKLDAMCAAQSASLVFGQMKNTVCAICLEDFKPTSLLRLLPCHHGFCVTCIDFWLTKKSSVCPICKYDCATVEEEEENDLGKMHSTLPSSSSTTPVPPTTTLTEHDLGTTTTAHTLLSPPPPYVQSSSSQEPRPPPPL